MAELSEEVAEFLSAGTRTGMLGYLTADSRPLLAGAATDSTSPDYDGSGAATDSASPDSAATDSPSSDAGAASDSTSVDPDSESGS